EETWVCVAAVATAHGIRGALKLRCFTERPEDVAAYGPVYDARGRRLFDLTVVGPAKGGVIANAEGIGDRTAAEALRGTELYVPRSALPDPENDEFYYSDLEGLDAFRRDGTRLGSVKRVVNHGAGDLIEIADSKGALHIVPFDKASVPLIDLENHRIEVAPRPEVVVEGEA
ncbi:MAG: ribosome maturation factor RimM, partial [Alphaproteobacteria bacterium]